mgnify:CR=1 FL=1
MKNMKMTMVALLVVALVIGLAGCGRNVDTMARIDKDGQVLMGTNAEFPPFEYRDETGAVAGFDVALAEEIAADLGVELVIEDMDFNALIAALNSGKIDFVAAGMTVTEDRLENADFSVAYFDASQVIIVQADNTEINGADDLAGKRIGVQEGTTGDLEASEIEGVEMFRYRKGIDGIMDLKNGNIDAVVIDGQPAGVFVQLNPDLRKLDEALTVEEYAIAVRKGDSELLASINSSIERIKNSGRYQEIYDEYIEQD